MRRWGSIMDSEMKSLSDLGWMEGAKEYFERKARELEEALGKQKGEERMSKKKKRAKIIEKIWEMIQSILLGEAGRVGTPEVCREYCQEDLPDGEKVVALWSDGMIGDAAKAAGWFNAIKAMNGEYGEDENRGIGLVFSPVNLAELIKDLVSSGFNPAVMLGVDGLLKIKGLDDLLDAGEDLKKLSDLLDKDDLDELGDLVIGKDDEEGISEDEKEDFKEVEEDIKANESDRPEKVFVVSVGDPGGPLYYAIHADERLRVVEFLDDLIEGLDEDDDEDDVEKDVEAYSVMVESPNGRSQTVWYVRESEAKKLVALLEAMQNVEEEEISESESMTELVDSFEEVEGEDLVAIRRSWEPDGMRSTRVVGIPKERSREFWDQAFKLSRVNREYVPPSIEGSTPDEVAIDDVLDEGPTPEAPDVVTVSIMDPKLSIRARRSVAVSEKWSQFIYRVLSGMGDEELDSMLLESFETALKSREYLQKIRERRTSNPND